MYRPKFCAECGTKIIRLRWRLWTSRKFCERCAPRVIMKEQSIQLAVVGAAVLLLGFAIGQATRPAKPPLVIQRSQESSPLSSSAMPFNGNNGSGAPAVNTSGNAVSAANSSAALAEEALYMCGARTKKGTPCTRRVHGPVRCWQHKGMPAMLSQEKLRVKE